MDDTAEFLAAFDEADETFVDLVLSDRRGLSFRHNGDWIPYQPGDDSLDGREVIEVTEDFAELVDRAQAARTLPTRADALKFQPDDGDQSEEDAA